MIDALVDFAAAALVLLGFVLLGLVAIAVAVGIPAFVGKMVYDRAREEDLSNPAMLGFSVAFFAVLVGLFVFGVGLFYVG